MERQENGNSSDDEWFDADDGRVAQPPPPTPAQDQGMAFMGGWHPPPVYNEDDYDYMPGMGDEVEFQGIVDENRNPYELSTDEEGEVADPPWFNPLAGGVPIAPDSDSDDEDWNRIQTVINANMNPPSDDEWFDAQPPPPPVQQDQGLAFMGGYQPPPVYNPDAYDGMAGMGGANGFQGMVDENNNPLGMDDDDEDEGPAMPIMGPVMPIMGPVMPIMGAVDENNNPIEDDDDDDDQEWEGLGFALDDEDEFEGLPELDDVLEQPAQPMQLPNDPHEMVLMMNAMMAAPAQPQHQQAMLDSNNNPIPPGEHPLGPVFGPLFRLPIRQPMAARMLPPIRPPYGHPLRPHFGRPARPVFAPMGGPRFGQPVRPRFPAQGVEPLDQMIDGDEPGLGQEID